MGLRADPERCGKSGATGIFLNVALLILYFFIRSFHTIFVAILHHSTGTIAEIFTMMSSVLQLQRRTGRMNLTPIR